MLRHLYPIAIPDPPLSPVTSHSTRPTLPHRQALRSKYQRAGQELNLCTHACTEPSTRGLKCKSAPCRTSLLKLQAGSTGTGTWWDMCFPCPLSPPNASTTRGEGQMQVHGRPPPSSQVVESTHSESIRACHLKCQAQPTLCILHRALAYIPVWLPARQPLEPLIRDLPSPLRIREPGERGALLLAQRMCAMRHEQLPYVGNRHSRAAARACVVRKCAATWLKESQRHAELRSTLLL
mmetsp:Transcript_21691/g.48869  ORF Transcript_21691/g.48869 Transcript_21691/m.48869 type:complete len:237 (+) Transcript_21691:1-711(+)